MHPTGCRRLGASKCREGHEEKGVASGSKDGAGGFSVGGIPGHLFHRVHRTMGPSVHSGREDPSSPGGKEGATEQEESCLVRSAKREAGNTK